MGTRYSALFFAQDKGIADPLADELFHAVDNIDRQMSLWKPDSDLCRLNRAPVGAWIDLPRELLRVLFTALEVERQSNGAFDIGVGAAADVWGFGPAGSQASRKRVAVRDVQARPVTAQSLEIDLQNRRARKHAAMTLDLNGIAKGFAVDEMATVMNRHGIRDWLVGIDGELRAQGRKSGGEPWSIAIERPTRGIRQAMKAVDLTNCAVATSGDYRHWIEHAGQTMGHTIDPRTDAPACHELASVTVMGGSCMRADAWATALMVLGPEHGPRAASALGIAALFVVREGGELREIAIEAP